MLLTEITERNLDEWMKNRRYPAGLHDTLIPLSLDTIGAGEFIIPLPTDLSGDHFLRGMVGTFTGDVPKLKLTDASGYIYTGEFDALDPITGFLELDTLSPGKITAGGPILGFSFEHQFNRLIRASGKLTATIAVTGANRIRLAFRATRFRHRMG
jgi:hypothetical protein